MVEGKSRDAWNHTSNLLAVIINTNRDPKKPPVRPMELNPHTLKNEDAPIVIEKMSDLKYAFVPKGMK